MTSIQLAKNAEHAAAKFRGVLSAELLLQVKLAHVAAWLHQQDDSIPAEVVLHRAQEAINAIHAREFAA
jgi:hypothetical protein